MPLLPDNMMLFYDKGMLFYDKVMSSWKECCFLYSEEGTLVL